MRTRVLIPVGLAIAGILSGCGPSEPPPELPPPPSERGEFGDRVTRSSQTPSLVLVVPAGSTMESLLLVDAATKEAGVQHVLLETRHPGPQDPPQAQADLIRQAARGGASAILVLVNDDPSLASAIDAVQRDGTPVIVVGDKIDCETPLHRVDAENYRKVAAELVQITIEDAKKGGLDVTASPILLVRELAPDSHAEERIEALEAGLKAAGHEPIRVKYADNEADAANALATALKEHPKTTLVFTDTDQATVGTSGVLDQVSRDRSPEDPAPFVYAGFLTDPIQVNAMRGSGSMVGFIDWNVPGIARAAVRDAIRLSQGEKLPEVSDVPTPLIRPRYRSSPNQGVRTEQLRDG